jgi:hypothetical protein
MSFLKPLGIVMVSILGTCIILFGICALNFGLNSARIPPDSIELVNEGVLTQVLWLGTPFPPPAKTLHITIDNGRDINMLDTQGDLQVLKIGQKVYLYDIYKDGGTAWMYISTSPVDLTQPPFSQYQLTVGKRTEFNCLFGKGDCKW